MERHGFYAVAGSGGGGPGPGLPPEIKVIGRWDSPTNNGNKWTGQSITIGAREPGSTLLLMASFAGITRFSGTVISYVLLGGRRITNWIGGGGSVFADTPAPCNSWLALIDDNGATTGTLSLDVTLGFSAQVAATIFALEINAGYGAADYIAHSTIQSVYNQWETGGGISGVDRLAGELVLGVITHRNTGAVGDDYAWSVLEPVLTERIETQGWVHLAAGVSPEPTADYDFYKENYSTPNSGSLPTVGLFYIPRKKAEPVRHCRLLGTSVLTGDDPAGGVTSWTTPMPLPARTPGSFLVLAIGANRMNNNNTITLSNVALGGVPATFIDGFSQNGGSFTRYASIYTIDNDTLTGDVDFSMNISHVTAPCVAVFEVFGYDPVPFASDARGQSSLAVQLLFAVDGLNDNEGNLYFHLDAHNDTMGASHGYEFQGTYSSTNYFLTQPSGLVDMLSRWSSATSTDISHACYNVMWGTFLGVDWCEGTRPNPYGSIGGNLVTGIAQPAGMATVYVEFKRK